MKRFITGMMISISFLCSCSSPPAYLEAKLFFEPGIEPDSWVLIPSGESFMGLHKEEKNVDYNYEIMVTDVTSAQYAEYLNQALADGNVKIEGDQIVGYYPGDQFLNHEHELEITAGDWLYVPLKDPGLRLISQQGSFNAQPLNGNHPLTMVTLFGTKAYCDFYGRRLPSELEWEKAARGVDSRPYPWGEKIDKKDANYYSSHDIFVKVASGSGGTSPVGFYNGRTYHGFQPADSPSPYGLYDMDGNVWQWTGDVYEGQHYRYLRGGSKDNYAYNLRVWTRNSAGPDYFSPAVAFRCARDVPDQ